MGFQMRFGGEIVAEMGEHADGVFQPSGADMWMKWLNGGLFGSYLHALDIKGRLIVPVAFRESLGKKFTIAPTIDANAIALYPTESWQAMILRLVALREKHARVQEILQQFTKLSYPGNETDLQGRVLIPMRIRSIMLGDAKEVEIIGAGDHIRIITSEASERSDAEFRAKFPDVLAFLDSIS